MALCSIEALVLPKLCPLISRYFLMWSCQPFAPVSTEGQEEPSNPRSEQYFSLYSHSKSLLKIFIILLSPCFPLRVFASALEGERVGASHPSLACSPLPSEGIHKHPQRGAGGYASSPPSGGGVAAASQPSLAGSPLPSVERRGAMGAASISHLLPFMGT